MVRIFLFSLLAAAAVRHAAGAEYTINPKESREMTPLYTLHVMPLLPGREAELARDAEQLLKDGVCTHVACKMTLVPEGVPAMDKAAVLGADYLAFLREFNGPRDRVGILLQATIGHGWTPDEPCDFRKIVRADGVEEYRMCPLDKNFLVYLEQQVSALAALKPAFFMVDDDFRMLTGHTGCMCPLHLAEYERRTGERHTAETLAEAVRNDPAARRRRRR